NGETLPMPDPLAEVRQELATANRILANEGVLDAFGHISMRHPNKPDRYLISRYGAAEIMQPDDILELTLDSKPVTPTSARLFSELVIHGCIYQARPDVHSVCHHHAVSVLPYCITGTDLVPVMHLGAALGGKVPFWDSRDEFGDTPLVVTTPEQGRSHARALGNHWMVLLRRHGATLAGRSLRECVFRSIYTCRNAELQSRAMGIGSISTLSPGEAEQCSSHSLTPRTLSRTWEYWTYRLRKMEAATAGFDAPPAVPKTSARRAKPPAKRAAARTAGRARKVKRAKKR
ncbi:MAG TPA: class II aldolase/adducin family protein, partial [Xanthobacteraceae bacterium]